MTDALDGWISGRHNQCPGLYCSSTGRAADPYPPEQLATVRESTGGGNVRFLFCDAEGRVVHALTGYWTPESLMAEIAFAASLIASPADAPPLRAGRIRALESDHAAAGPRSGRAVAARLRALRDLPAGRPVGEVLREIEDDIYRKGAIG
ncbi:MAG: hypothetical protein HUU15_12695 [Candidatus Brocadiae bacterium]|nr:hypothetical protein [Candidatus Brocadiia bacterium]